MIYSLGEKRIQTVGDEYYVAPGACVIGNVRFGIGASVWFNCVLRGDSDWIILGDGTNIQDGTIIHADEGEPATLGSNVSVGHRALLHGCTVGDSTLIANGAMILDRVTVGTPLRDCRRRDDTSRQSHTRRIGRYGHAGENRPRSERAGPRHDRLYCGTLYCAGPPIPTRTLNR